MNTISNKEELTVSSASYHLIGGHILWGDSDVFCESFAISFVRINRYNGGGR